MLEYRVAEYVLRNYSLKVFGRVGKRPAMINFVLARQHYGARKVGAIVLPNEHLTKLLYFAFVKNQAEFLQIIWRFFPVLICCYRG